MNISVVIPVYNAARFVKQAVESVLEQPETEEIILVEDASPDDGLAVCRELASANPKVRLLQHPDGANHGAGASRNLAIRNANCEVIAFLDADDFYLPGRFTRAREILSCSLDIDGVYEAVGYHLDNEAARERWQTLNQPPLITMSQAIQPEILFEALTAGGSGFVHTNGITVRRCLFDRTGLFNEYLRIGQDVDMWVKMAAMGRLTGGRLGQPVACVRVHDQNRIFGVDRCEDAVKRRDLFFDGIQRWAEEKKLSRNRRSLLLLMKLSANYCLFRRQSGVAAIGAMAQGLARDAVHWPSVVFSPYLAYHLLIKLWSKAVPRRI